MSNLYEKYRQISEEKNSVLCAGLDPANYQMGRGSNSLPQEVNKEDWCMDYISSVAPYVCAIKPNTKYWFDTSGEDVSLLKRIIGFAKEKNLLVIEDSKLADIGSTNDSGIDYAAQRGVDALTIAPYAGNMEETQTYAQNRGIDLITMCLMSNPEYELQKNKLVPVCNYEEFDKEDIFEIGDEFYIKSYIYDAKTAADYGISGIVIGASNHVTNDEIAKVMKYSRDDTLVLMPGIGAQGGEIEIIRKHIILDNLIVNVGRGLMFPNGSNSTSQEQAQTAKIYRDMINNLR